jgi:hypothetical protein
MVQMFDVWVVQRRGSLGFSQKTRQCLWVLGYIIRKKLKRDKAMKASVLGFVDDTHTAATELLEDTVVRDGLSDERVGPRHNAAILGCDSRASQ